MKNEFFFDFLILMLYRTQKFFKKFQDNLARVKFPVESKSEPRMGIQNNGKPGNQKYAEKKLYFEINIDI